MEVAMEDDLLFADLNRQISLLIMDDEEDHSVAHYYPSMSLQAALPPAIFHPQHPFPYQAALIQNPQDCRREIRGTGVFIPKSSQPRRKNKGSAGRNSSSSSTKSCNNKKHHLVNSRVGYATSNNSNDIPASYNYNNMINRF